MKSIVLSSKEVAVILGCSENHARKVLRDIRLELNKEKGYRVSRQQFANYFDYSIDEINNSNFYKKKP